MGKYFVHDTPLAALERQMMMVPNFAPCGSSSAVLCRYRPTAADVDCRNCLQYRRRSCRSLSCLYLSERLEAGVVRMDELIVETVRPCKHLPLKQRAVGLACREERFRFEGQLHVMRMEEMTKVEAEYVNSRWLATVYLRIYFCGMPANMLGAVRPGQNDFSKVRLRDSTIQDYVLYRAAKGICSGTLGATSEELADPELVDDDTLLLILCAVVTVRYGPEVVRMGRTAT